MDTRIERKSRFKKKHIYSLIGIAVGLLCLLWLLFRDTSSSLKVEKERITIATVQKGEFNDYIRVIGQVLPDRIIYLDAIEGGRVEERLIEEGAQVRAGDVILRLSNPLLNIGILQSEADLAYQENELRNTRLSMEQEHLRLKQDRIGLSKELVQKERRFRQYERLYKKNLLAREDYLQAEEDYEAALGQLAVVDERIEQDDLFRSSQLQSLDENIRNMKKSLALVRGRLENLKVKAPVDGQLGNLEAQIGQSIAQGERIGQVITPELKVEAKIDEHYVERVMPGLPASFEREGKKYDMEVTKVYPEVREGQFRIRRKQCVSQSRFERESFGQSFTDGQSEGNWLMVLNVDHLFCLTQIRHSIFKNQCLIVRYLHQTVGNRKHIHTRHISMRAGTDFCGCSARISNR